MQSLCFTRISVILLLLGILPVAAFAAPRGTLQVGAAKVDITPPEGAALPMSGYAGRTQGFHAIHDRIYVRAIVLNDGSASGAIVVWELVGNPNTVWSEVSERIAKESGIPAENLLMAAVHNHNAPSLSGLYERPGATPNPKTAEYTAKVKDAAVEAVRQAKANLQPARVGFGTGKAYVNINRREFFPDKGWWWLGYNPDGPSDKTVAVLKFESLSGKPIALFINYPVHAVVMGPRNLQISGDLAGATSRFVEQYYKGRKEDEPRGDGGYALKVRPAEVSDGVVAVWTSGAAGDQNPVAMSNTEDFTLVNALGEVLGEETVRVANGIKTSPEARIWGAQRVVTCPGRTAEAGPRPRQEYKFVDADPVSIRLSLLMVNRTALAGVSGEVFTNIALHLKKDSPFNQTIMLTHTNGSSGYIPSDAPFDRQNISYENTTSRLKPGCAEDAIVNGFVDMMKRY